MGKGDDPLTVGHEHGYQPTWAADGTGITGATCSEWVGYPGPNDDTFKACWTHFQFYDHDTSDDDEIQLVTIQAPGKFEEATANDKLGFGLVYTDLYGGVWETRSIPVKYEDSAIQVNATVIRAALTTLPNEVIPDCGVNVITKNDNTISFQVTFTSPHNSGDQHMLGCNINQCTTGCSPWIAGMRGKKNNDNPSTVHCHVLEPWHLRLEVWPVRVLHWSHRRGLLGDDGTHLSGTQALIGHMLVGRCCRSDRYTENAVCWLVRCALVVRSSYVRARTSVVSAL